MADMQPPELHLVGGVVASVIPPPTAAAGVSNQVTSSETVGSKRQRRPSVRLGDIGGDSLYDPYSRKSIGGTSGSSKQWKQQVVDQKHKDSSSKAAAAFKTRALTDYTTETLDESSKELNLEKITIGSWRVKDTKKRAPIPTAKRVRSSWVTKIEEEEGGGNNNVEGDFDSGEDMDDDDGDGNSEDTPSKEDSHENLGDGNERNEREIYYNNNNHKKRSSVKSRSGEHHHNMSNHHHHQDGVELLSVPSETDTRGGGGSGYRENNNEIMCGAGEDGVRIWLDNLGLGRYAPVFEIHEVDDEVLPMLTLEDLKDMGINAVGSRRKMFAAIQKLNKGFS